MALLVQNALRHLKVKYKDVNQNGNNVECKYEKHRLLRKNLRVQSRKSISKICFFCILFSCIDVYKEFS